MNRRALFSLLPFSIVSQARTADPITAAWNEFAHAAKEWVALYDQQMPGSISAPAMVQWTHYVVPLFHRVEKAMREEL